MKKSARYALEVCIRQWQIKTFIKIPFIGAAEENFSDKELYFQHLLVSSEIGTIVANLSKNLYVDKRHSPLTCFSFAPAQQETMVVQTNYSSSLHHVISFLTVWQLGSYFVSPFFKIKQGCVQSPSCVITLQKNNNCSLQVN